MKIITNGNEEDVEKANNAKYLLLQCLEVNNISFYHGICAMMNIVWNVFDGDANSFCNYLEDMIDGIKKNS